MYTPNDLSIAELRTLVFLYSIDGVAIALLPYETLHWNISAPASMREQDMRFTDSLTALSDVPVISTSRFLTDSVTLVCSEFIIGTMEIVFLESFMNGTRPFPIMLEYSFPCCVPASTSPKLFGSDWPSGIMVPSFDAP